MTTKTFNPINLPFTPINFEKTTSKMPLSEVFSERKNTYVNELNLFVAHFNAIPNLISEKNIDCQKAIVWFSEIYKNEILDYHYMKRYFNRNKEAEIDDLFYVLYEDLLVDFDTINDNVRFLFKKTSSDKVDEIIKGIKKFKIRKSPKKPKILLLTNGTSGIGTTGLNVTKPKLNIVDNYNDDFKDIHKTISNRLNKKLDKGLVLLHGKPGTGKTFYIRYLVSSLKKDVIFLPPNMASAITNPDLMSILIENQNSIFVIEDAENIIIDRESNGNSPVSALLNISDGLLSDCLNIQIICSFNTDISKVDSALMRKGRLIAKYEFKELTIDKAQALSNKLGFVTIINTPTTLTAIYNQNERDFQQSRRVSTIGFIMADAN